jgi:hypothetical protein
MKKESEAAYVRMYVIHDIGAPMTLPMMVPMPKAGPAVAKVAGEKAFENVGYIRRTLSPTHPCKTGLKAVS